MMTQDAREDGKCHGSPVMAVHVVDDMVVQVGKVITDQNSVEASKINPASLAIVGITIVC